MKIKTFKTFNESKSDIDSICDQYGIENYTIDNGLVNVNGDVNLSGERLTKLPVRFGIVTGNFDCKGNGLTDLNGSPNIVHGDFYCMYNQLTTLEGSPNIVHGNFWCEDNENLTSLKGAPDLIGGVFNCIGSPIYSIFQSYDPELIHMFNAIFMDGVDMEKIQYWFDINNKPLTDEILSNIKQYYPNI
jgi:hypothetical protein